MEFKIEIKLIGGLIILAAITKRAQIPFSSWLPAAIAAPTPVSALVHSSTLVTAGVYLLIRFHFLFINYYFSIFLLLISGLTIFISGLGANFEFDLKKIIALSTLRQLGLIMSILSIRYYMLAFFHLLTHALFKALLFLCAGAIIHNIINFQDIRFIGGLLKQIPLTSICFNTANLALCGIPFLAGFYSKDLILEIVSLSYINYFRFIIYFLSTGLTVIYSFRLVYYSITGEFNCFSFHPIRDDRWIMLKGILSLLFMIIFMGRILRWIIFPTPLIICLPIYLKLLTLLVCILGGRLGYFISLRSLYSINKSLKFYKLSYFRGSIWFIPFISTLGLNYSPLILGNKFIYIIDQGWLENFGSQKIYFILKNFSIYKQLIINNNLKLYLIRFIIWIIIFLTFSFLYIIAYI